MGDVDVNTLKTLLQILDKSSDPDAKIQALEFLLGLTGSSDCMKIVHEYGNIILSSVLKSLFEESVEVAKKACSILINISAEKRGVDLILSVNVLDLNASHTICKAYDNSCVLPVLFEIVLKKNNDITDFACIILSNLSRSVDSARKIYVSLENPDNAMHIFISRLVKTDIKIDHLASFLSNMSQLKEIRSSILNSSEIMYKLLTLIDFKTSVVRRKGAIGIIRNLSFYNENHEILLDPENDLLVRIMLPLAGPEELDDEDNEKLPLELQYLSANKERESSNELRKMLIEIFMQLAATACGRQVMRDANVYVIFREYHKWETDAECLQLIEDFVNILIRTEEEIGVDCLRDDDGHDREMNDESFMYVYM